MSPDVINEIIWHFAGYFRIADDVARDRIEYLEGAQRQQFEDYSLPLPETPFHADLDPFDTDPIPPPASVTWESAPSSSFQALRSRDSDNSPEPEDIPPPPSARPITSGGGGGGGGGGSGHGERLIKVNYDDDGSQAQIEIRQLNAMEDNDVLLVGRDTGVTELNDTDVDGTLQEMGEAAAEITPDELELPTGTMEVVDFIEARDTERLESGGGGNSEHTVAPGIYVNGELQNAGFTPTLPHLSGPENVEPTYNSRGEIANLGSNDAANAALIVDRNEGSPTMIVLGDYFATEAIVQTYSYSDRDDVSVGGTGPVELLTANNSGSNIASFDHQESIYPDLDGYFSGWNWDVHVVEGNFYDINLLVQRIYLSDNDVTVQETQHSLYEVRTGENQLFNLAELFSGDLDYDLIIIGGDYHGGNYIFQHAFLIDDDVAMMGATDGGHTQTLDTGNNSLTNYGAIHTYGNERLIPLSDEARDLATELSNRATSLDPDEYGFVAPAVGPGPLNVLYVTGDYYDVNAIWQYITVADADTALQLLSGEEALTNAEGGALIQSMQTGGNTLLNDAAIVDVGTGTTEVGGDIYTDTILVQAELVAIDHDDVTHGNTDALVNELIAFIGSDEDDEAPAHPIAPVQHEDMLGGMLT
jgi:hypothetical protein